MKNPQYHGVFYALQPRRSETAAPGNELAGRSSTELRQLPRDDGNAEEADTQPRWAGRPLFHQGHE
jgi:hypothetical protein